MNHCTEWGWAFTSLQANSICSCVFREGVHPENVSLWQELVIGILGNSHVVKEAFLIALLRYLFSVACFSVVLSRCSLPMCCDVTVMIAGCRKWCVGSGLLTSGGSKHTYSSIHVPLHTLTHTDPGFICLHGGIFWTRYYFSPLMYDVWHGCPVVLCSNLSVVS